MLACNSLSTELDIWEVPVNFSSSVFVIPIFLSLCSGCFMVLILFSPWGSHGSAFPYDCQLA